MAELVNDLRCRICPGVASVFLLRENVPVQQNFVFRSQQDAQGVGRGDLRMAICSSCGFVFNAAFEPALVAYDGQYENDQSCSPSFSAYADELVRYLVEDRGVQRARVVEVGCGQGYFLRRLILHPDADNSGTGFDPTYRGQGVELEGRLRFERRYYGADAAETAADVVVCRHVIEHLQQPLELLQQVHRALALSPKPKLFFETPCVEWILRNDAFWDFFYEHCSLFTAASLRTAFEASGFRVDQIRHLFGGQYLFLEGERSSKEVTRNPGELVALAHAFAQREKVLRRKWASEVADLARGGGLAVWGAGAKGVTFVNLIDPLRTHIDCVVDLNPAKQGTFIAGSAHPIVDYLELSARGVTTAIVMNPNYIEENRRLLEKAGIAVTLIVTA